MHKWAGRTGEPGGRSTAQAAGGAGHLFAGQADGCPGLSPEGWWRWPHGLLAQHSLQNQGGSCLPLPLTPLVFSELLKGTFQTIPSWPVRGLPLEASVLNLVPGVWNQEAQRNVGEAGQHGLPQGRSQGSGSHGLSVAQVLTLTGPQFSLCKVDVYHPAMQDCWGNA